MNNTLILILFFAVIALVVIVPIFIFGYLPLILRTGKMRRLAVKYGCIFDPSKKEVLRWAPMHIKLPERDATGKFVLEPPIKRNIISGQFNGHTLEVFDSYQKITGGDGPWATGKQMHGDRFERRTVIIIDGNEKVFPGATPLNFPSVRSIHRELESFLGLSSGQ